MTDPWEREYKRIQRKLGEILKYTTTTVSPVSYNYLVNCIEDVYDDMELTRRRLIRPEYPKEK